MSTPRPGEIRCPTCRRSTPPSAFCTQCGAPIVSSSGLPPRGMDRDELDDGMRLRRSGDAPFRRGTGSGDSEGDEPRTSGGHEPFRPEPEDALVRRSSTPNLSAPLVDHTPPEPEAEPAEPPPQPPFESPPEPEPAAAELAPPEPEPGSEPAEEPAPPLAEPVVAFVPPSPPEPRPEESGYEPDESAYRSGSFDDGYRTSAYVDEPRRGSFGPLAVVAVVALGLMAIGLGAILSGVFSGVASASPSPTLLPSVAATASPTAEPSATPTATQAASSTPTVAPSVPANAFTAQTQPCAAQPESISGCDSSGSTVSGDTIWVWVGFRKGNDADLITATVLDSTGGKVDDGTVSLSIIGCGSSCNGWLRFRFSGLTPGNYGIRIDRNGQLVAESSFVVSG